MEEEHATVAEHEKSLRRVKITTLVLFVVSAALAIFIYTQDLPPPAHLYDSLAKCIAQSSTTFYGAFWCPHCRDQKTKFGTGAQFLPYHECSLPSGSGEVQSCVAAGVKNYPTWVFSDGSRLVGVQSPATLAQKTNCPLPTST
jgi:thiol-disulfide isomerase/thioredoxin